MEGKKQSTRTKRGGSVSFLHSASPAHTTPTLAAHSVSPSALFSPFSPLDVLDNFPPLPLLSAQTKVEKEGSSGRRRNPVRKRSTSRAGHHDHILYPDSNGEGKEGQELHLLPSLLGNVCSSPKTDACSVRFAKAENRARTPPPSAMESALLKGRAYQEERKWRSPSLFSSFSVSVPSPSISTTTIATTTTRAHRATKEAHVKSTTSARMEEMGGFQEQMTPSFRSPTCTTTSSSLSSSSTRIPSCSGETGTKTGEEEKERERETIDGVRPSFSSSLLWSHPEGGSTTMGGLMGGTPSSNRLPSPSMSSLILSTPPSSSSSTRRNGSGNSRSAHRSMPAFGLPGLMMMPCSESEWSEKRRGRSNSNRNHGCDSRGSRRRGFSTPSLTTASRRGKAKEGMPLSLMDASCSPVDVKAAERRESEGEEVVDVVAFSERYHPSTAGSSTVMTYPISSVMASHYRIISQWCRSPILQGPPPYPQYLASSVSSFVHHSLLPAIHALSPASSFLFRSGACDLGWLLAQGLQRAATTTATAGPPTSTTLSPSTPPTASSIMMKKKTLMSLNNKANIFAIVLWRLIELQPLISTFFKVVIPYILMEEEERQRSGGSGGTEVTREIPPFYPNTTYTTTSNGASPGMIRLKPHLDELVSQMEECQMTALRDYCASGDGVGGDGGGGLQAEEGNDKDENSSLCEMRAVTGVPVPHGITSRSVFSFPSSFSSSSISSSSKKSGTSLSLPFRFSKVGRTFLSILEMIREIFSTHTYHEVEEEERSSSVSSSSFIAGDDGGVTSPSSSSPPPLPLGTGVSPSLQGKQSQTFHESNPHFLNRNSSPVNHNTSNCDLHSHHHPQQEIKRKGIDAVTELLWCIWMSWWRIWTPDVVEGLQKYVSMMMTASSPRGRCSSSSCCSSPSTEKNEASLADFFSPSHSILTFSKLNLSYFYVPVWRSISMAMTTSVKIFCCTSTNEEQEETAVSSHLGIIQEHGEDKSEKVKDDGNDDVEEKEQVLIKMMKIKKSNITKKKKRKTEEEMKNGVKGKISSFGCSPSLGLPVAFSSSSPSSSKTSSSLSLPPSSRSRQVVVLAWLRAVTPIFSRAVLSHLCLASSSFSSPSPSSPSSLVLSHILGLTQVCCQCLLEPRSSSSCSCSSSQNTSRTDESPDEEDGNTGSEEEEREEHTFIRDETQPCWWGRCLFSLSSPSPPLSSSFCCSPPEGQPIIEDEGGEAFSKWYLRYWCRGLRALLLRVAYQRLTSALSCFQKAVSTFSPSSFPLPSSSSSSSSSSVSSCLSKAGKEGEEEVLGWTGLPVIQHFYHCLVSGVDEFLSFSPAPLDEEEKEEKGRGGEAMEVALHQWWSLLIKMGKVDDVLAQTLSSLRQQQHPHHNRTNKANNREENSKGREKGGSDGEKVQKRVEKNVNVNDKNNDTDYYYFSSEEQEKILPTLLSLSLECTPWDLVPPPLDEKVEISDKDGRVERKGGDTKQDEKRRKNLIEEKMFRTPFSSSVSSPLLLLTRTQKTFFHSPLFLRLLAWLSNQTILFHPSPSYDIPHQGDVLSPLSSSSSIFSWLTTTPPPTSPTMRMAAAASGGVYPPCSHHRYRWTRWLQLLLHGRDPSHDRFFFPNSTVEKGDREGGNKKSKGNENSGDDKGEEGGRWEGGKTNNGKTATTMEEEEKRRRITMYPEVCHYDHLRYFLLQPLMAPVMSFFWTLDWKKIEKEVKEEEGKVEIGGGNRGRDSSSSSNIVFRSGEEEDEEALMSCSSSSRTPPQDHHHFNAMACLGDTEEGEGKVREKRREFITKVLKEAVLHYVFTSLVSTMMGVKFTHASAPGLSSSGRREGKGGQRSKKKSSRPAEDHSIKEKGKPASPITTTSVVVSHREEEFGIIGEIEKERTTCERRGVVKASGLDDASISSPFSAFSSSSSILHLRALVDELFLLSSSSSSTMTTTESSSGVLYTLWGSLGGMTAEDWRSCRAALFQDRLLVQFLYLALALLHSSLLFSYHQVSLSRLYLERMTRCIQLPFLSSFFTFSRSSSLTTEKDEETTSVMTPPPPPLSRLLCYVWLRAVFDYSCVASCSPPLRSSPSSAFSPSSQASPSTSTTTLSKMDKNMAVQRESAIAWREVHRVLMPMRYFSLRGWKFLHRSISPSCAGGGHGGSHVGRFFSPSSCFDGRYQLFSDGLSSSCSFSFPFLSCSSPFSISEWDQKVEKWGSPSSTSLSLLPSSSSHEKEEVETEGEKSEWKYTRKKRARSSVEEDPSFSSSFSSLPSRSLSSSCAQGMGRTVCGCECEQQQLQQQPCFMWDRLHSALSSWEEFTSFFLSSYTMVELKLSPCQQYVSITKHLFFFPPPSPSSPAVGNAVWMMLSFPFLPVGSALLLECEMVQDIIKENKRQLLHRNASIDSLSSNSPPPPPPPLSSSSFSTSSSSSSLDAVTQKLKWWAGRVTLEEELQQAMKRIESLLSSTPSCPYTRRRIRGEEEQEEKEGGGGGGCGDDEGGERLAERSRGGKERRCISPGPLLLLLGNVSPFLFTQIHKWSSSIAHQWIHVIWTREEEKKKMEGSEDGGKRRTKKAQKFATEEEDEEPFIPEMTPTTNNTAGDQADPIMTLVQVVHSSVLILLQGLPYLTLHEEEEEEEREQKEKYRAAGEAVAAVMTSRERDHYPPTSYSSTNNKNKEPCKDMRHSPHHCPPLPSGTTATPNPSSLWSTSQLASGINQQNKTLQEHFSLPAMPWRSKALRTRRENALSIVPSVPSPFLQEKEEEEEEEEKEEAVALNRMAGLFLLMWKKYVLHLSCSSSSPCSSFLGSQQGERMRMPSTSTSGDGDAGVSPEEEEEEAKGNHIHSRDGNYFRGCFAALVDDVYTFLMTNPPHMTTTTTSSQERNISSKGVLLCHLVYYIQQTLYLMAKESPPARAVKMVKKDPSPSCSSSTVSRGPRGHPVTHSQENIAQHHHHHHAVTTRASPSAPSPMISLLPLSIININHDRIEDGNEAKEKRNNNKDSAYYYYYYYGDIRRLPRSHVYLSLQTSCSLSFLPFFSIPWEVLRVCRVHSVSRVPSIAYLLRTLWELEQQEEEEMKEKDEEEKGGILQSREGYVRHLEDPIPHRSYLESSSSSSPRLLLLLPPSHVLLRQPFIVVEKTSTRILPALARLICDDGSLDGRADDAGVVGSKKGEVIRARSSTEDEEQKKEEKEKENIIPASHQSNGENESYEEIIVDREVTTSRSPTTLLPIRAKRGVLLFTDAIQSFLVQYSRAYSPYSNILSFPFCSCSGFTISTLSSSSSCCPTGALLWPLLHFGWLATPAASSNRNNNSSDPTSNVSNNNTCSSSSSSFSIYLYVGHKGGEKVVNREYLLDSLPFSFPVWRNPKHGGRGKGKEKVDYLDGNNVEETSSHDPPSCWLPSGSSLSSSPFPHHAKDASVTHKEIVKDEEINENQENRTATTISSSPVVFLMGCSSAVRIEKPEKKHHHRFQLPSPPLPHQKMKGKEGDKGNETEKDHSGGEGGSSSTSTSLSSSAFPIRRNSSPFFPVLFPQLPPPSPLHSQGPLQLEGGLPYAYLHARSPSVLACLWDVTDVDIDGLLLDVLHQPDGNRSKRDAKRSEWRWSCSSSFLSSCMTRTSRVKEWDKKRRKKKKMEEEKQEKQQMPLPSSLSSGEGAVGVFTDMALLHASAPPPLPPSCLPQAGPTHSSSSSSSSSHCHTTRTKSWERTMEDSQHRKRKREGSSDEEEDDIPAFITPPLRSGSTSVAPSSVSSPPSFPHFTSLGESVAEARGYCRLPMLTGAATILFGVNSSFIKRQDGSSSSFVSES